MKYGLILNIDLTEKSRWII